MRLKSLYIKDYKNIKDQTFDFSANTGYIALIGLNGSGKSNLLEAISLIFDELYGIPSTERVNGYIITFQIAGGEYTYRTVDDTDEHNIIPLNRGRNPRLPSSVIACYSGEDLRLWRMAYEKYYMQYFKKAVRNRLFSPQVMYINKYCWKIAFIALLCSPKENVKKFLKEKFHYNDINDISVKFIVDDQKRRIFANHNACRWYDALVQNTDQQGMINANFLASTDMTIYGAQSQFAPDYVFQFLYLLALPKKDRQKRQTIDRLITDIKINVNNIEFDDLSEGEKKLILIECITQIIGDENALVLLDEPDAHVHVDYKKELLEETIIPFNGQTIFTTHSPVVCNLIPEPQNIKLLKEGIWEDTSKLEQLKKLTGNEMQYFEGAFVLSSKNILVTEGIYDIRYLRKAIDVFARRNPKYEKLKTIGMLYAGSANEEHLIYEELLKDKIDKLDHIVFLFDYDKPGLAEWKVVKNIARREPKLQPIFYQQDYTISLNTADDKVHQQDSILVEDMFDEASYASLFTSPVVMTATHKYFRCRQEILSRIKTHIQNNYASFDDRFYNKYEALLDKLMDIFGLN